ncbi:MAG: hypothetical protein IJ141_03880 [Lachnospiraceae bacterium]|nr:hypothetical protein [Lachnospiraceae bacterium]
MWKELRYCKVGDLIKATFLGNYDPSDPLDYNWHFIYTLEEKNNGKYYASIEGWRGGEVYGSEEVFVKD